MKAILKACKEQGIDRELTRGGHFRFFRADDPKNVVIVSQTSSDYRAEMKIIRDLKNKIGFVWPWDKKAARRKAKKAFSGITGESAELDFGAVEVVTISGAPEPELEVSAAAEFAPGNGETKIELKAVVEKQSEKHAVPEAIRIMMNEETKDNHKDISNDVTIDMVDQVLRALKAEHPELKPTITFSITPNDAIVCRLKTGAADNPKGDTAQTAALALWPIVENVRNQLLDARRRLEQTLKILGVEL